jgi:pimeloyl-ACP methyl ester carboxylesterase
VDSPAVNRSGRIDHVIYVHGLWMNGTDGLVLRRRLARDFGLKTHAFRYRSVSGSMSEIAVRLRDFARRTGAERVHFVGHSLGGLVIYRMFQDCLDVPPGRVVFLGVPAVCSGAARGVQKRLGRGSAILGRCIAEELLSDRSRRWSFAGHELGIVAGTRPMGLGRLFASFDCESDGTVGVSETRIEGASDFVTVPTGHMGLVMSAKVARETGNFLRSGRFAPGV